MSRDADNSKLLRDVDAFANLGLRTLVFGYKEIDEKSINLSGIFDF
jgi:magnesium-transporting ATPase (P-type)